jgi:hypothetical protein
MHSVLANSIELYCIALHLYKSSAYVRTLPSKYPLRRHFFGTNLCPRIQWDKEHFDAHPIGHDTDESGDARNGVFNRSFFSFCQMVCLLSVSLVALEATLVPTVVVVVLVVVAVKRRCVAHIVAVVVS